jgi:magnesium transporter
MARFFKNRSIKEGKFPGEMPFVGNKKSEKVTIKVIEYNAKNYRETDLQSWEDYHVVKDENSFTWLKIVGLHNASLIASICSNWDIHSLTLDDIVNTGQRPKVEDFGHYFSIALKTALFKKNIHGFESEHLFIIVTKNVVITFQESPSDLFDSVIERLKYKRGRVRRVKTDYLAYVLLDTIFDNYLTLVEKIGTMIEEDELLIIDKPNAQFLQTIDKNRKELHYLNTFIRPARDVSRQLNRLESSLIEKETLPYYRSLYSLATEATEALENYRELLKNQLESLSTLLSNSLNETMKFLTVFSAIFIPLSFLAGVYGTNFTHVPEFTFKYGYLFFWALIVIVAAFMIFVFRKKKWL